MTAPDRQPPMPLWAGRTTALLGILLVAFNVRTAVSALSPIVEDVAADVGLSSIQLGIIGTIPPIAFALSALFGASIARRVGVERLLAFAIVAMVLGHVLRASAGSFALLLLGTVIALAGAGIGNVLLPPLVKRYFSDRLGLVTAIYVSLVSVSAAVPSAMAAPVTAAFDWRVSLGIWAIVAAVCLPPWIVILLRHRRAALDGDVRAAQPARLHGIWRSRVAWSIALIFSVTSGHVYAAFAWLPQLLIDTAGVSAFEAGTMLGVYALMGVPTALAVPALAVRMRNVGLLVHLGVTCFVLGYLGLLLAPSAAPWLWIVLVGLGPLVFPLSLTLINLRTRTQQGSVALSGFSQGIGYGVAALGPFIFALLHEASGGWTVPLLYLLVTALVASIAGVALRKPVFVEDELEGSNPA